MKYERCIRKIVINSCYGGFGLSPLALRQLADKKGVEHLSAEEISRDDKDLVLIVEKLGKKSWGNHSELKIVEIPCNVDWEIEEYDGVETIVEKHRKWI